jgi:hypothetical protein
MLRVAKIDRPPVSRRLPVLADAAFHDVREADPRDDGLPPIDIARRAAPRRE